MEIRLNKKDIEKIEDAARLEITERGIEYNNIFMSREQVLEILSPTGDSMKYNFSTGIKVKDIIL